jgi:Kef-type K+ transport system membrane component KefB
MIAAVPVAIVVLLYPYAVSNWHWPDIARILKEYMPASSQNSAVNTEAASVVLSIIFGGNIFGIGAGDQAIRAVLPAYTSAVSYSDIYSASVWLQILCWSGIFGFVCFVVIIGFIAKRSFRCFARSYQKEYQGVGLALFSAILLSLILGLISNIWVNEGMMYLFWINVGLLLSHIRNADSEREKRIAFFADCNDSSDTELIFYK